MAGFRIERRIAARGAPDSMTVGFDECSAMPASTQIQDVSTLVPGRAGSGVRLAALVEKAGGSTGAQYVNVASRDPSFSISLPLAEAGGALVVYALDGEPLPASKGGPFRLLVPGHADECVNVKQLASIELSDRPGRDTRPKDDAEHAKLHQK